MDPESATGSDVFVHGSRLEWESVGEGIDRMILGHDDGLMLVRVRFLKGSVGAIHRHPHRQVSYVESGSFEVEIDGEKSVLVAGDSFFVPPELDHGAVALEDGVLLDVFAPAREDFISS
jgi:quercetin dioxygenase-like cupin family protein